MQQGQRALQRWWCHGGLAAAEQLARLKPAAKVLPGTIWGELARAIWRRESKRLDRLTLSSDTRGRKDRTSSGSSRYLQRIDRSADEMRWDARLLVQLQLGGGADAEQSLVLTMTAMAMHVWERGEAAKAKEEAEMGRVPGIGWWWGCEPRGKRPKAQKNRVPRAGRCCLQLGVHTAQELYCARYVLFFRWDHLLTHSPWTDYRTLGIDAFRVRAAFGW